jgi:hypothetical protein
LTAKTTQMSATAMLIGQISSAYSLPRVSPSGQGDGGGHDDACQPQKWIQVSRSEAVRALHRRWVE